jgi:EAL domain-containing protein (putative c-di-GMP-specific phosphodiesterase class I)
VATELSAEERAAALDEIIERRLVRSLYQPIVDFTTGGVVGYEALVRGPEGSPLERPDLLFDAARHADRIAELDWCCRIAALEGALEAGLAAPFSLFVNMEPEALDTDCPEDMLPVWSRAQEELRVVAEITERALMDRPAELLHGVAQLREAGCGVALDDVGAQAVSLALVPFLDPDVIKLDLRLAQNTPTPEIAEIVNAVNAETERTGVTILAEGIETDEHLATSMAMGGTIGQGWHFGKPVPLPTPLPEPGGEVSILGRRLVTRRPTPSRVVSTPGAIRKGPRDLLVSMSRHLENQAEALGEAAVILSAFEHADDFGPGSTARYAKLAEKAAFVGVLGVDMPRLPAPGVRGEDLAEDDPLRGEWAVSVIGPHFAAALVARGSRTDDQYEFAITYDRDYSIQTARSIMSRISRIPDDSLP